MKYIAVMLCCLLLFACKEQTKVDTSGDWTMKGFQKADSANPVMIADGTLQFVCPVRDSVVHWAEKDVFNPAAVVRNDTVFLLFRAEDSIGKYAGTSRIGLAWSIDGFHFSKYAAPVLYPENDAQNVYEWEGGCEDPRVVQDSSGNYIMTYTAYDGNLARLMVAHSSDLMHWIKDGPAFAKQMNGRFTDIWSKSGSIVSTYSKGTPVAVKINGKYWMYWGDTNIYMAWSDDLLSWNIVTEKPMTSANSDYAIKPVFGPREGKFDSDLVESGPPAMITDEGILLLYNSRNVPSKGDTTLAEGTYAASQILFDKNDPAKVLQRMDTCFIRPDRAFEISGQVNQVCFIEGLVKYHGRWFLYYGTADSRIAVTVK